MARVASGGDAVAVEDATGSLSYCELNELVRRIAAGLAGKGVRPGDRVAVSLNRSRFTAATVLAVLWRGCTYVPVDLDLPLTRIEAILDDANVSTVVSTRLRPLAIGARRHPVFVEDLSEANVSDRDTWPAPGLTAAPIYLLFTSGSTGRPKGVLMPERSIANLLSWQWKAMPSRGARVAHMTALGFDVAAQELLYTLGSGGTLVCVDDVTRRDPALLLRDLTARAVNQIFLPFIGLQQLATAASHQYRQPPLAEVVTAGEQLIITPAIRAWFAALPGAQLRNQYGPTETHVVSECVLAGPPTAWPDRPSIGWPIDGVTIELFDNESKPVPNGMSGQIGIAGPCLADGYVNNPVLTERAFREVNGRRFYFSGDIGRRLADRSVTFEGRLDDQIKIRGYRVELGECEAVLGRHADVLAVACVADSRDGETRLLAFVVVAPTGALAEDAVRHRELRAWMTQRLPAYMVPKKFIAVPTLPLTTTGKTARRQLLESYEKQRRPAAREVCHAVPDAQDPPGVAEQMRRAMSEVLGEDLTVRDDFFMQGGDSVLAAKLVHHVQVVHDVTIAVSDVFERPTASKLAPLLLRLPIGVEYPKEPAQNVSVPASPAQRRFWIAEMTSPRSSENLAPLVVRCEGRVDGARLREALAGVVARHPSLRTEYKDVAGALIQAESGPIQPSLTELPTFVPPSVLLEIAAQSLDPLNGRPFAAAITHDANTSLIALALHHICTDAHSESILLEEVSRLYTGDALLAAPMSPRALARWLETRASADVQRSQLDYWAQHLSDVPALPFELIDDPGVRRLDFSLPERTICGLTELAHRRGRTLFMYLLSAFFLAIRKTTTAQDVVVVTPIAERQHPAFSDTIACSINTLALRASLTGGARPHEVVDIVSDCLIEGLKRHDVAFDDVVANLPPQARQRARALPIFSVDREFGGEWLGLPAQRVDDWHPGGPIGPLALILRPTRERGAKTQVFSGTLFHRGLSAESARALAVHYKYFTGALCER